ncbi:hypothetical protein GCM10008019_32720 [Deinococcus soli (ex Cha et al. 2016)]|nr:hypothetical protein GCM10008019_32720 [Deinococcus soli (ex Cha et al. 2016)]
MGSPNVMRGRGRWVLEGAYTWVMPAPAPVAALRVSFSPPFPQVGWSGAAGQKKWTPRGRPDGGGVSRGAGPG